MTHGPIDSASYQRDEMADITASVAEYALAAPAACNI